MAEPNDILDLQPREGEPRITVNRAFAVIRALLPTSAEKASLATPAIPYDDSNLNAQDPTSGGTVRSLRTTLSNIYAAITAKIAAVQAAASTWAPSFRVIQGTTGPGTVSNTAGGSTVTGTGTTFTTTFRVGDTITVGANTVAISAIASDTSMTTAAIVAAHTNVPYSLVGGTRFQVDGNGKAFFGNTGDIYFDQDGTLKLGQGYIQVGGGSRDYLILHSGAGGIVLDGTVSLPGITTSGTYSNAFYMRSGYTYGVPAQLYGYPGQTEPLAKWNQKDSTGSDRYVGALDFTMPVTTSTVRTGRASLRVCDYADEREIIRCEATGSAPAIGFLGASAVTRPTLPTNAVDAATSYALINAIKAALIANGLAQ